MKVQKDWTVLVYAAGANDLAGSIRGALEELVDTEVPDTVEVLVRHVDGDGLARDFRVRGGRAEPLPGGLDGVQRNAADPETLRSFLELGIRSWPAKHVALVVNGHGEGHGGVASDFRCDDQMSLADFEKALQGAAHPLDAVIFEACLMGSAEVVHQLQGEARTVVASEDVVRAGRIYPRLLRAVGAADDGPSLGRALVEDGSPEMRGFSSMASARPDRAAALERSLRSFSEVVLEADEATVAELRRLSESSTRATQVQGNILLGFMPYDGPRVDLEDFARRVGASEKVPPSVAVAARATAEAVSQMVDAHRGGALSLYLPQAHDPSRPLYEEPPALVTSTGWDRAVERISRPDPEGYRPPSWVDLMQARLPTPAV